MKKVIPISKSSIGLKCGDCLFFRDNKKFEQPCAKLGVKHFQNAPACYSPNVYKLGSKNPDVLLQLGLLLKDFNSSDSRILMSLLKQASAFEKHYGLQFGQPVYIRMGDEYVSNYFRAFAIGVAESGEGMVFLSSDMGRKQRTKPAVLSVYRDSVLTSAEWKKHKVYLEKKGLVEDPSRKISAAQAAAMSKLDYEPPTIDSAPKEYKDRKSRKLAKSKLRKNGDGTLEFLI